MGQSGQTVSIDIYEKGIIKLKEEIYDLERRRDGMIKDMSLPKKLDKLREDVAIEEEKLQSLKNTISNEILSQSQNIQLGIENEVGSLKKKKAGYIEDVKVLEKKYKDLSESIISLNKDMDLLKISLSDLNVEIENKKLHLISVLSDEMDMASNKKIELTDKETILNALQLKVNNQIKELSSREDELSANIYKLQQLKAEHAVNVTKEEKRLFNILKQNEATITNRIIEVDDRVNSLRQKEQECVYKYNDVFNKERELSKMGSELQTRMSEILKREQDLDTNWQVYAKEKQRLDANIKRMS